MQRLEKLDSSIIKPEVGNILNKNELLGIKNSIAFNFGQIKILDFTPRLIVLCKLPLLFIKRT